MNSKCLPLSLLGCIALGLGAGGCSGGPDAMTAEPISSEPLAADVSVPAGASNTAQTPAPDAPKRSAPTSARVEKESADQPVQRPALTVAPSSDSGQKVEVDAFAGGLGAFGFPGTYAYFYPYSSGYVHPWGGAFGGGLSSGVSSGVSSGFASGFSSGFSSGTAISTTTTCGLGFGCTGSVSGF